MTNNSHYEYGNIERLHELIELETQNTSHIKPLRNNKRKGYNCIKEVFK